MKTVARGWTPVPFLILLHLPAFVSAEATILFSDNFSYLSAGSVSMPSSTVQSNPGHYTTFDYIYPAGGIAKLGKSGVGGTLTTTNLTVQTGTLSVQVDALGWDADEKTFTLSIGASSTNLVCAQDKGDTTLLERFTHTVDVAAGVLTVSCYTANGKRVFLDNIVITHTRAEVESPLDFFVYHHSPTNIEAMSELAFTITACTNGVPAPVTYTGGLPESAVPFFDGDGRFTWVPGLTETGVFALVFTAMDAHATIHEKRVWVEVTPLPLIAPQNLIVSALAPMAFHLAWSPVWSATAGYLLDIWYGSADCTILDEDGETFFEIANSGIVAAPAGYRFQGITEQYSTAGFVELKFNDAGDVLTTKRYPAPVSALSFRLKGYGTSAFSNTLFQVHATSDDAIWQEVGSYNTLADEDGDDENNILTNTENDLDKQIMLNTAQGFRRFRFTLTSKTLGNIGFARLAARYDGSGTRFVTGWHATPVQTSDQWITGVPHTCELFARVGATDGQSVRYTQVRLNTPACPKALIFSLR